MSFLRRPHEPAARGPRRSRLVHAWLPLLALAAGCARRSEAPHAHEGPALHTHERPDPRDVAAPTEAPAPRAETPDVASDMATAARALLSSLGDQQRAAASFEVSSDERFNWHYVPRARKGLPLKQMSGAQRSLAQRLLQTALSPRGYLTATQIVELEQVLREIEGDSLRDPGLYFVSIFGAPGAEGAWGWRFEGHHLSLNVTIVGGRLVSGSPSFYGANPARVPKGKKNEGARVLAAEEDLGRALLMSLPDAQRAEAIVADRAYPDIVSGTGREAEVGAPKGLPFARMSAEHRQRLRELVELYARRLRDEMAAGELAEIERAGWHNVFFAWAGGVEPGRPHYYRLQGPTFLVEYDNTQNDASHVHTVWRDLKNDFGVDLLREHYEAHRNGRAHRHE
jgi:uncharacterized protein DUF3500